MEMRQPCANRSRPQQMPARHCRVARMPSVPCVAAVQVEFTWDVDFSAWDVNQSVSHVSFRKCLVSFFADAQGGGVTSRSHAVLRACISPKAQKMHLYFANSRLMLTFVLNNNVL